MNGFRYFNINNSIFKYDPKTKCVYVYVPANSEWEWVFNNLDTFFHAYWITQKDGLKEISESEAFVEII